MDYTESQGKVTSFSFVIADWGSAGWKEKHYGGTPVYASATAFQKSADKDIFAFGRIAAELYLPESGKLTKLKPKIFYDERLVNVKRLVKIKLLSN